MLISRRHDATAVLTNISHTSSPVLAVDKKRAKSNKRKLTMNLQSGVTYINAVSYIHTIHNTKLYIYTITTWSQQGLI